MKSKYIPMVVASTLLAAPALAQTFTPPLSSGPWSSSSGFATRHFEASLSCSQDPDGCEGEDLSCTATFSVPMGAAAASQAEVVLSGFDIRTPGVEVPIETIGVDVRLTGYNPSSGVATVTITGQIGGALPNYDLVVSGFVIQGAPPALYSGSNVDFVCGGAAACSDTISIGAGSSPTRAQLQGFCLGSTAGPVDVRRVALASSIGTSGGTSTVQVDGTFEGSASGMIMRARYLVGFVSVAQSGLTRAGGPVAVYSQGLEAPFPASAPWLAMEGFDLGYQFGPSPTWEFIAGWTDPVLSGSSVEITWGAFLGDVGGSTTNAQPFVYDHRGRWFLP